MTTYNLLELITVYVKKLLEKDKKKPPTRLSLL